MELIDEFFDLTKPITPVVLPPSGGSFKMRTSDPPPASKGKLKGIDYAREIQNREDRVWRQSANGNFHMEGVPMSYDIPDANDAQLFMNEERVEELLRVYRSYDFTRKVPGRHLISEHKERILHFIKKSPVSVIQGTTGCGKSTQVPQFILDYCYENYLPCNIIVTQPRKLAAISTARRVCIERNWPLGSLVGFQVGLNVHSSPDTRLTFCTTGVLLEKIISAKHLNEFTHIILDEVHERNQDMDFTMAVVRKLLRTNSSQVRVILMSATIDPKKYCNYFSTLGPRKETIPAPIIDVDKERRRKYRYTVTIFYMCQLKHLGPIPDIRYDKPGISEQSYDLAYRLILQFDVFEKEFGTRERGAVLVFLPGYQEIEVFYNILSKQSSQRRLWICPLHSTITTDEQENVFQMPAIGYRKVILSTNIAESSITVTDIVYVIDFCLTKQLVCDPTTNFSCLQAAWASKTNCVQRAGRVGRVRDGRVYRLVPRRFYEERMCTDSLPEILRCPLDRVLLQSKVLDLGPPKYMLGLCLDPPDLSNIERTIVTLKEAGALLTTFGGRYDPEDGELTFLGHVMSTLPVDVHVSRLIMLGHVLGVLDECVVMGAALSLKTVFSSPFQKRMTAFQSKLMWADSSCSDCFAVLNAYSMWREHVDGQMFEGPNGEEEWAKHNFLQLSTLRETHMLVCKIKERLARLRVYASGPSGEIAEAEAATQPADQPSWTDSQRHVLIKVALAGAFYPNYFVRSAASGQVCEREAVRLVGGRDPRNTVFLQGLPPQQPGELYAAAIKNALRECDSDMKVTFDGSSKVYVQFPRVPEGTSRPANSNSLPLSPVIPGPVGLPVYKAVKLRQLRVPLELPALSATRALEKARTLGLQTARSNPWHWRTVNGGYVMKAALPSVDTSCISIEITYVESPGRFWALQAATTGENTGADETLMTERAEVEAMLNEYPDEDLLPLVAPPAVGQVYAAPFPDTEGQQRYYRAQVQSLRVGASGEVEGVEVFLIDYGARGYVATDDLRDMGEALMAAGVLAAAPQAFLCSLAEVRPSQLAAPRGGWAPEAYEILSQLSSIVPLYGRIYSVVHRLVSLDVYTAGTLPFPDALPGESVNKYLIRKGWAEWCREPYLSRLNHDARQLANSMRSDSALAAATATEEMQDPAEMLLLEPDPEPPHADECEGMLRLKGPFSPLEMKMYALTREGRTRTVFVDWSSVNSVLLDSEPQDPHELLLVAASVGENADRNTLTARNTTLMPNVHGFSSLMCLIFAPKVELRVSEDRTHLTGALCGLGAYEDTGESFFPDHDMEITFDVAIDLQDVQDVNRLRYWMTRGLVGCGPEAGAFPDATAAPADALTCRARARHYLMKLLWRPRESQEVQVFPSPMQWYQVHPELLLPPRQDDRGAGTDAWSIFPLHWGVALRRRRPAPLFEDIQQLHAIASGNRPWPLDTRGEGRNEGVLCRLCSITAPNPRALQVHLLTPQHREKELAIAPGEQLAFF